MPKNVDDFERATMLQQLDAAVEDTNKEIAAFGWSDDDEDVVLDATGDRSLETMGEGLEGQHEEVDEDDADGDGEKEAAEGETETGDDGVTTAADKTGKVEEAEDNKEPPEPEGRVPSARLREATDARKAAEAERDRLKSELETERGNARRELDGLKAELRGALAALKPDGQPKGDAEIDSKPKLSDLLFENPDAFTEGLVRDVVGPIRQQLNDLKVENSLRFAHQRHGETYVKAFEAFRQMVANPTPEVQRTVIEMYNAPDQGEALINWYKRNETLRVVGNDPSKYEETIAARERDRLRKDPEFRKQLLAELRAQAEDDGTGRPNTTVRLPRSLNGAAGNSRETFVPASQYGDSQEGIFHSAWDDR